MKINGWIWNLCMVKRDQDFQAKQKNLINLIIYVSLLTVFKCIFHRKGVRYTPKTTSPGNLCSGRTKESESCLTCRATRCSRPTTTWSTWPWWPGSSGTSHTTSSAGVRPASSKVYCSGWDYTYSRSHRIKPEQKKGMNTSYSSYHPGAIRPNL